MKWKFNRDTMPAFETLLWREAAQLKESLILTSEDDLDMDRLLIAGLEEMAQKIHQRLAKPNPGYEIVISPVQGFAIRAAYAGRTIGLGYLGNEIHQLCNEIDRQYA